LGKNGLKVLKCFHLVTACCWLGGAFSLSVLNVNNAAAASEGVLYGLNIASHLVDMWVVVAAGAMGCLVTGLLYSLLSGWGFIRHKWVVLKWVLTIAAILSGTFFLGVWEQNMLELSRDLGPDSLSDPGYLAIKAKHLQLSTIQICALLFMVIISVFKPWGRKSPKPN
ncbi:hypothetical protein LJB86_04510, partial [Deltaproteobacteria bacterium OttesenSCG-928-M10]|nr:hypothetical protein [Deltaproteobacteria bacterium OttesenSCG-928-M10]